MTDQTPTAQSGPSAAVASKATQPAATGAVEPCNRDCDCVGDCKAGLETNTAASGMGELPELPPATVLGFSKSDGIVAITGYTADQMHAYARQALAAQPAPVVGGSDWYAEQHARDSKELRKLCESRDFYKRRCDSLQALQPNMRDPERKAVCDILANGTTTALSTRPAESVAQGGEGFRGLDLTGRPIYGGQAAFVTTTTDSTTPATGSGGEVSYPDDTGWAGPGHGKLGQPSPCCPATDGRKPTLYAEVAHTPFKPLRCSHCNKGSWGLHYPDAVKP